MIKISPVFPCDASIQTSSLTLPFNIAENRKIEGALEAFLNPIYIRYRIVVVVVYLFTYITSKYRHTDN